MALTAAKTLRARFVGNLNGNNAGFRVFLQPAGAGPYAAVDLAAIAQDLFTLWNSDMSPHVSNAYQLTEVILDDLSTAAGLSGSYSGSSSGSLGGQLVSAETCVLMNYTDGAVRYRGGKPRTYLPSMTSNQLASSIAWHASDAASYQSAFGTWFGHINALSNGTIVNPLHSSVHWHGPANTNVYPVGTPYLITSYGVNIKPASQRRRLRPT